MIVEDNDLNDPEDAYDVTDPVRERLRNFLRRIEWLIDRIDLDQWEMRVRLNRLRDDIMTLRDETED